MWQGAAAEALTCDALAWQTSEGSGRIIEAEATVRVNNPRALLGHFTLTKAAYDNTTEEYRKQMLASVRSPRLGAPEDIAAMVAFLFSDDGAYINGQTILVDGGANLT